MTTSTLTNRVVAAVSVPWNAFVVAFLYYTVLAAVLLGGSRAGAGAVTTAYLVPPLAYAVTLALRGGQYLLARVPAAVPGVVRVSH